MCGSDGSCHWDVTFFMSPDSMNYMFLSPKATRRWLWGSVSALSLSIRSTRRVPFLFEDLLGGIKEDFVNRKVEGSLYTGINEYPKMLTFVRHGFPRKESLNITLEFSKWHLFQNIWILWLSNWLLNCWWRNQSCSSARPWTRREAALNSIPQILEVNTAQSGTGSIFSLFF